MPRHEESLHFHSFLDDSGGGTRLGRLDALLSAIGPDGAWALAGRRLAGFTNDEQTQAGFAENAPWLLEDRMREAGGEMASGPAWQPFVVVDNNLVTGQNPGSAKETAQKVADLLDSTSSA